MDIKLLEKVMDSNYQKERVREAYIQLSFIGLESNLEKLMYNVTKENEAVSKEFILDLIKDLPSELYEYVKDFEGASLITTEYDGVYHWSKEFNIFKGREYHLTILQMDDGTWNISRSWYDCPLFDSSKWVHNSYTTHIRIKRQKK